MSNLNNILSHTDCISQEQMHAYLENKLDKQAQYEVENHLTDCAFCSDAMEGLQMLPAEESNHHLADVKNDIENLLFATEEKTETIVNEKITKEVPPLTSKKGGKRITLAAAAGLFLLVFAGGLVVFSYINNNTNWFNDQQSELAKSEESTKDVSLDESKTTNRELETFRLDEDDLNTEENEIAKNNSPKKSVMNKAATKTREDALARNTQSVPLATPPLPKASTAPVSQQQSKNARLIERQEKPKAKEIVAQNERTEREELAKALQAGQQNTYSQPLYDGKLKDLNKEPALTKASEGKKSSKITVREEAVNIDAVASDDESSIQSTQYSREKKKAITDNYTLAMNAFTRANYKESIRFFKRALRQKDLKNREEANYYLALSYEQTNEFAKARKIYEELEKSEAYKKRAQSRMREMPVK